MRAVWRQACTVVMTVVFAAYGCSGNEGGGGNGAGSHNPIGAGGDGFDDNPNGCELTLEPSDATILVEDGASQPIELHATRCGQQVYPTSWSVDYGTIATVSNKGNVAATNVKGGLVTVTATDEGATATAKVAVHLHKVVNDEGIGQAERDALLAATEPDGAITWAYPYDGTVWPRGLLPPTMMWNGSIDGDLFLLRLTGEYIDMEIYTSASLEDAPRYTLLQDDWIAVSESGNGHDVALHAARLSGGSASVMVDHEWTMARANMRGTVYYWSNSLKRIVRIKPGELAPDDFLAAAGYTSKCSGCHTVSANGKALIIGGDIATSNYDLLAGQSALDIRDAGGALRDWAQPAVSPDGAFVVESETGIFASTGGKDGLWNANTGQRVAGSGLDGVTFGMPAFSPKGHKLVYIDGAGAMRAYDFDLAAGTASNDALVLDQGGEPIRFPNVSPTVQDGGEHAKDSTYVVYHRGSLDTRYGDGDLYLASLEPPGSEWRLARANGDSYPFAAGERDLHENYEPTFAPAASGGYFWVVFTGRRTYGNRLTGNSSQVKQLWMMAVDAFPEPGTDPSHPAFWVPGQDPESLNMRAFWALDPCIQSGNECSVDAECCDGKACQEGVCGGPEACVDLGGLCQETSDCCDPQAECIANECALAGPK